MNSNLEADQTVWNSQTSPRLLQSHMCDMQSYYELCLCWPQRSLNIVKKFLKMQKLQYKPMLIVHALARC